ncbi:MAG: hypothetical protein EON95_01435 [Caulobacteraceae bacterium]|nr:MAG: hypothetical protein EON95_01435 [Caulobacteraceae bacterium]
MLRIAPMLCGLALTFAAASSASAQAPLCKLEKAFPKGITGALHIVPYQGGSLTTLSLSFASARVETKGIELRPAPQPVATVGVPVRDDAKRLGGGSIKTGARPYLPGQSQPLFAFAQTLTAGSVVTKRSLIFIYNDYMDYDPGLAQDDMLAFLTAADKAGVFTSLTVDTGDATRSIRITIEARGAMAARNAMIAEIPKLEARAKSGACRVAYN